jgi:hypothetical protein
LLSQAEGEIEKLIGRIKELKIVARIFRNNVDAGIPFPEAGYRPDGAPTQK